MFEQAEQEDQPQAKNKAGNGLKSKNSKCSKHKGSETIKIPSKNKTKDNTGADTSGTSKKSNVKRKRRNSGKKAAAKNKNKTGAAETTATKIEEPAAKIEEPASKIEEIPGTSGQSKNVKRKRPLLDLNPNLEDESYDANDALAKKTRFIPEDEDPQEGSSKDHVFPEAANEAPKASGSKKDDKPKIELSEAQLHGPFDFFSHRPNDKHRSNMTQQKTTVATAPSNNPSPEVFTVEDGPPIVVQLDEDPAERTAEMRELYSSFRTMFPDTPQIFLQEQAEELVGKPAAIDRFVTEHLARECQPPDYWVPKPQAHGYEQIIVKNNEQPKGQDQARETIIEAIEANVPPAVAEVVAVTEPVAPIDVEEDNRSVDGNIDNVETEEEKTQKKWSTLQVLFPQTDPEFLHLKLIELNGNEEAINRWVEAGIESKGKDFPTKEAYEQRQKVSLIV